MTNRWRRYSPSANTEIHAKLVLERKAACSLSIDGTRYLIDWRSGVQVRLSASTVGIPHYHRRFRPIGWTALPPPLHPLDISAAQSADEASFDMKAAYPLPLKCVLVGDPHAATLCSPSPLYRTPLDQEPAHWPSERDDTRVVTLSESSDLFKEAAAILRVSLDGCRECKVSSIVLHCDHNKFQRYSLKGIEMERNRGEHANEQLLWHGTSEANASAILQDRFDATYGRDMKYGDGCYFARRAAYSINPKYAKPNKSNDGMHQVIMLCSVLVGNACAGHKGMKRPEPGCHATTNSMSNPSLFCVGNHEQVFVLLVYHVIT